MGPLLIVFVASLPFFPVAVMSGVPFMTAAIIAVAVASLSYGWVLWGINVACALGISIASFLAWRFISPRIQNLNMKINYVSLFCAVLAIVSLLIPWWYFNAKAFQVQVVEFTVYPGWYGGNLGLWVDAIRGIGSFVGIDPFSSISGQLQQTLYLFFIGALISLIGTFITRNMLGRITIGAGLALYILGVANFYNSWVQSLTSIRMSSIGSQTISPAGIGIAEATWSWTWGFYLGVLVCILSSLAVVLHPYMPRKPVDKSIGCLVITMIYTSIAVPINLVLWGDYITTYAIFPELPSPIFWYAVSVTLSFIFNVGILGYILVSIFIKKRKENQAVKEKVLK